MFSLCVTIVPTPNPHTHTLNFISSDEVIAPQHMSVLTNIFLGH